MNGSNGRLAGLYDRQTLILSRIQGLEAGPCYQLSDRTNFSEEQASLENKLRQDACSTEDRLGAILRSKGIPHRFVRVPADYYEHDLEYRRNCLKAESIHHLCKSIVLENTKLTEPVPGVYKYYCVIVQWNSIDPASRHLTRQSTELAATETPSIGKSRKRPSPGAVKRGVFLLALKPVRQYAARLHAEKLKRCLYQSQKAAGGTLGTKAFNMRLCPEDVSDRLTGFQHNAVTPIGSASPDMPIVLSHRILKQLEGSKGYMWLGGGEVDLKLGFYINEFIRAYKPLILDCTYDD